MEIGIALSMSALLDALITRGGGGVIADGCVAAFCAQAVNDASSADRNNPETRM
jgi:hypothetical protein